MAPPGHAAGAGGPCVGSHSHIFMRYRRSKPSLTFTEYQARRAQLPCLFSVSHDVLGSFTGQVTFGSILLVSAGGSDVFVAKWDAAAQAWTSAVSGGSTGTDQGLGVAVGSAGGVASVYVTGSFSTNATIAGTTLTAAPTYSWLSTPTAARA